MKKLLVCLILVLVFATGCQTSDEKREKPRPSDSLKIQKQEYDVSKSGKECIGNPDRTIYFSNDKLLCYSQKEKKGEVFFLYERENKKSDCILTVKNIDSCWGNMYEKNKCLYMAVGRVVDGKESSSVLKIDENTRKGELISIQGCNTIFSSVVCSDEALFVWYMKEKGKESEYCLNILEKGKIYPVQSWIWGGEKDNNMGKNMSTFGTNGEELFCYVEDDGENAFVEVYGSNGKKRKEIPVDFSDFQKISEESDVFWQIHCFRDILCFETLNHRILLAKYDGEHITRIQDDDFLKPIKEKQSGDRYALDSGSYSVLAAYPDKIVLSGNLANTNVLLIWDIDAGNIYDIDFKIQEGEILSYQMLSEKEVMVTGIDDNGDSKVFYCKLEY